MARWTDTRTPRDQFKIARGEYEKFLSAASSVEQLHHSELCAQAIWHLRDWVYNNISQSDRDRLGWAKVGDAHSWLDHHPDWPKVRLCRDLSNASKHGDVHKNKAAQVHFGATTSASSSIQPIGIVVRSDGEALSVIDQLNSTSSMPLYFAESVEDGDPRHRLQDGGIRKLLGATSSQKDLLEPILHNALQAWEQIFRDLGL